MKALIPQTAQSNIRAKLKKKVAVWIRGKESSVWYLTKGIMFSIGAVIGVHMGNSLQRRFLAYRYYPLGLVKMTKDPT